MDPDAIVWWETYVTSSGSEPPQSENFYRHLVENSLGLICSHDFQGVLTMVNRAAAESLGYQPEELIGRSLRDLIPAHFAGRVDAYLERIRKHGQARGYLELRTKAGAQVTWLYRNRVYAEPGEQPVVIGHAQDITWRLHMERTLRETADRFRGLFEDAPVAYHEIDAAGIIRRVNRAECELLGYGKDELIGKPVWDLVAMEQRSASREKVRLKLAGLEPLKPFHREYVRKDGSRLSLYIHEKLIHDHGGKVIGIRSTLLDLTAQRRVEDELRRLNATLDRRVAERTRELYESAERLREFVYTVSHDLQEPLRTITSFATLLKNRYSGSLDEDGIEFLNFISSGATRMSGLIQDLLTYSRVLHDEADDQQAVSLADALEVAKKNLSQAIQAKGARIVCGELPVVRARPYRIAQLFQNLLSNALKYCGDQPPEVHIWCDRIESAWLISVKDSGVGVPPEDRERIFGLFKRGRKSVESGSGVGLAICRAIVERHGGRIWVDPAGERGSIFRFTLPDEHQNEKGGSR